MAAAVPAPQVAAVAAVAPAEDLITQDGKRPYKPAFGKARQDIMPEESVYAAPAFNLIKREAPSTTEQRSAVAVNISARDSNQGTVSNVDPSTMSVSMLTARPRVDMDTGLGEIADGRANKTQISFATKLGASRLLVPPPPPPAIYPPIGIGAAYAAIPAYVAPGPLPKTKPTIASNNTGNSGGIFHTVTQANPDGVMRTKMVVNR
jgi:hypothetical protein